MTLSILCVRVVGGFSGRIRDGCVYVNIKNTVREIENIYIMLLLSLPVKNKTVYRGWILDGIREKYGVPIMYVNMKVRRVD